MTFYAVSKKFLHTADAGPGLLSVPLSAAGARALARNRRGAGTVQKALTLRVFGCTILPVPVAPSVSLKDFVVQYLPLKQ